MKVRGRLRRVWLALWLAGTAGSLQRFSTQRRGYDVEQVDAFLDQAELRLAAMRATNKGAT